MREESVLSQVVAILKERFVPGNVVDIDDIDGAAPWLERNRASASLAILTTERYGMLRRLDEKGDRGARKYEVMSAVIDVVWNPNGKPAEYRIEKRRAPPKTEDEPPSVDRELVDDKLTEASLLIDDHDYEGAMEAIRVAYFEIRNR